MIMKLDVDSVSKKNISLLVLFQEVIAVYSENHTKLRGQNVDCMLKQVVHIDDTVL
jgi:hypothetical protein